MSPGQHRMPRSENSLRVPIAPRGYRRVDRRVLVTPPRAAAKGTHPTDGLSTSHCPPTRKPPPPFPHGSSTRSGACTPLGRQSLHDSVSYAERSACHDSVSTFPYHACPRMGLVPRGSTCRSMAACKSLPTPACAPKTLWQMWQGIDVRQVIFCTGDWHGMEQVECTAWHIHQHTLTVW